jgi:hypothetical protein
MSSILVKMGWFEYTRNRGTSQKKRQAVEHKKSFTNVFTDLNVSEEASSEMFWVTKKVIL